MSTGRPPGLAMFNNRMLMAWKGVSGDERLWWSSFGFDGSGWAGQQQIPDVGSSMGPSLASFRTTGGTDIALAAWKGVEGDERIWWSRFDGSWTKQEQIPGVGTSVGPSLGAADGLFSAWKGSNGDERIWWSRFNGRAWTAQQQIPGVGSSVGPSLTPSGGGVAAAWKGIAGDERIWWSFFDGSAWAAQQQIPGVGSSVGPSLGGFDATFAGWKGIAGDERIWWSSLEDTGTRWAAQRQIPGVGTSVGPSFAWFYDSDAGAPAVFAAWKGIEGDESIWWSTFVHGSKDWAPQQRVPGVGTGP